MRWLLALAAVVLSGCGSGGDGEKLDPDVLPRYQLQRVRHDPVKFGEVDLGEFFVTRLLPNSPKVLIVRCQLFAVVDKNDTAELEQALLQRRSRMRDAVISLIQKAELESLEDPDLTWLRDELTTVINRTLDTLVVRDVAFSDLSIETS